MNKRTALQCKVVLSYLKKNKIVGEENAISVSKLTMGLKNCYSVLFSKDFCERQTRRLINFLRRGEVPECQMTRMIGSSCKGYFLVKKGEDGLRYQRDLAKSTLITAVQAGVPKEYFYRILNELENKNVADNQVVLPITKGTHKIAHIYSDDLLEKGE